MNNLHINFIWSYKLEVDTLLQFKNNFLIDSADISTNTISQMI